MEFTSRRWNAIASCAAALSLLALISACAAGRQSEGDGAGGTGGMYGLGCGRGIYPDCNPFECHCIDPTGGIMAVGATPTGGTGGIAPRSDIYPDCDDDGGCILPASDASVDATIAVDASTAASGCLPWDRFERSCQVDLDCVAVLTGACCDFDYVGIRADAQTAFAANTEQCAPENPICDCGFRSTSAQDGTSAFEPSAVQVRCEASLCRTFVGDAITCGNARCGLGGYCLVTNAGPAGSAAAYDCAPLPTDCADCTCLLAQSTMDAGCECVDDVSQGPTVTCSYP